MALYDPILIGVSFTWQMTAETGGAIQSFRRTTSRTSKPIYDAGLGYDTGIIFHNPKAEYSIEIIQTGNTGLAAASPGVVYALSNTTSGNGVNSGGVYVDTVEISHTAEDFRKYTVTATQRPAIA